MKDYCPEIFVASWKIFGLPGDLVSNIINKEAYRKPQKFQEAPKKVQKIAGQKSRNIFVGIMEEIIIS